jgi:hypothetical protein
MAVETRTFTDAERMELRSHVELAGEAISSYWPMRTFIHHNPLHGLEDLPFDQAVKRGEQLLGGKGYLPSALYRRYFEQGRIRQEDLTRVLAPLASERRACSRGVRFPIWTCCGSPWCMGSVMRLRRMRILPGPLRTGWISWPCGSRLRWGRREPARRRRSSLGAG